MGLELALRVRRARKQEQRQAKNGSPNFQHGITFSRRFRSENPAERLSHDFCIKTAANLGWIRPNLRRKIRRK
jgi:hypothetical protein